MDLIATAKARGQVEKWLLELESGMKKSVSTQMQCSFDNFTNVSRENWVLKWPGQCVRYYPYFFLTVLKWITKNLLL